MNEFLFKDWFKYECVPLVRKKYLIRLKMLIQAVLVLDIVQSHPRDQKSEKEEKTNMLFLLPYVINTINEP